MPFVALDAIADAFLQISIPQLTEEGELKNHAQIMPLSAILTFILLTRSKRSFILAWKSTFLGLNVVVVAFIVGIIIAIIIHFFQKRGESYREHIVWLILLLNMVCSILWLATAAGTIVDLINVTLMKP